MLSLAHQHDCVFGFTSLQVWILNTITLHMFKVLWKKLNMILLSNLQPRYHLAWKMIVNFNAYTMTVEEIWNTPSRQDLTYLLQTRTLHQTNIIIWFTIENKYKLYFSLSNFQCDLWSLRCLCCACLSISTLIHTAALYVTTHT